MTGLAKVISLLLILVAATGSPAWCWPAHHAPQQDLAAPDMRLVNAPGEDGPLVFSSSRGTLAEMTWLARRPLLVGMLAGHLAALSAINAFGHALSDHTESSRDVSATASLLSLHSQLTV